MKNNNISWKNQISDENGKTYLGKIMLLFISRKKTHLDTIDENAAATNMTVDDSLMGSRKKLIGFISKELHKVLNIIIVLLWAEMMV